MQVERIPEMHVKPAWQPEFLSHSDRERAAVHEHRGARVLRGERHDLFHPGVVQRVALHGREQTNAAESEPLDRMLGARGSVRCGRVEHEEPDKPGRMARDRLRDRRLVARDAADERRAADTGAIELLHPSIGEIVRCARSFPAEGGDNFGC